MYDISPFLRYLIPGGFYNFQCIELTSLLSKFYLNIPFILHYYKWHYFHNFNFRLFTNKNIINFINWSCILAFLLNSFTCSDSSLCRFCRVFYKYDCLLFLFLLSTEARISSLMLDGNNENVPPCFVPNLKGKAFSLSLLSISY